MLWITLLLFGLAIALWHYSHIQTDEIGQVLALTFTWICLIAGFVIAPLLLKTALLTTLLLYPACTSTDKTFTPACPRYCLSRNQCKPSPKASLF